MKEAYLNKIYYRKTEIIPNRETLVLLHGICSSASAWKFIEDRLKDKYNLIIPDLRGNGKSIRPRKQKDYSWSLIAADVYKILNKEKIKKCTFIGSSSGNHVTFEFAKRYQKK